MTSSGADRAIDLDNHTAFEGLFMGCALTSLHNSEYTTHWWRVMLDTLSVVSGVEFLTWHDYPSMTDYDQLCFC